MAINTTYTPKTNYVVKGTQDLGERYITKSYFIDNWLNLTGVNQFGLYAWGDNSNGTYGNGTTLTRSSPIQIASTTQWSKIASTPQSVLAIKSSNNTLWTWGGNGQGQLGSGTTVIRSSPVQVGTLSNWKSITGGVYNVSSIKTDGTLWTWGYNSNGQLGSGTTVSRSSPVQVGTLTNWNLVASSYYNVIAIKTDGTLWMWGSNFYGNLGLGNTIDRSSPVQVGTLTNWKIVSGGAYATSAIKTDGTLWTWGAYLLIQGTPTYYSSPVQVGTLSNWKYLASHRDGGFATKTDGTLWAWGHNNLGQLGDGTTIDRSSPVQIGSLTNWKTVVSSYNSYNCFAIKTDGTLWAWGNNGGGYFGNGSTINASSPVQIGTLSNWISLDVSSTTIVATNIIS